MKVLAIKRPWAERIALNDKTIEVRSRLTHVEGRVAVYSTLTKPKKAEVEWVEGLGHSVDVSLAGHIICTVEICGAGPICDQTEFDSSVDEHLCSPDMYRDGLWNWYLRNPIQINPIPFKMKRGAVVWDSIDNHLIEEASLK